MRSNGVQRGAVIAICALCVFFSHGALASTALGDGAVVKGFGPEVYFMENGMRRWIVNERVFNDLALPWSVIQTVSDGDLAAYPRGEDIVSGNQYPNGALVRGDPARGGDGMKIYTVENGARRWIETEQDFENLGLDWGSVMDIPADRLQRIYEGKSILGTHRVIPPATVLIDTPPKRIEDVTATFQFNGITVRQDNKTLQFETFLEGVDSGWVSASGGMRQVRLPEKSGTYRFFVRAKDMDGVADRTPEEYTFDVQISPLYGAATLLGGNVQSTNPSVEQLTVQGRTKGLLDITGWTLHSDRFHTSYTIPDAYEITNNPFYEYKKDISIDQNSTVTIISGKSPSGVSFRTNKCIGYLNQYYTFTPSLPNLCPWPNMTEAKQFNAYCRNIISQASNCREPNLNDILIDADCRAYLGDHFSYAKCVEANYAYYDFFGNEWRVYLGYAQEIWNNDRDTITLRDKDGLVVSSYTY